MRLHSGFREPLHEKLPGGCTHGGDGLDECRELALQIFGILDAVASHHRHVLGNPAVVLDADSYRAAYRAYESLAETYQELASIALERAMGEIGEEAERLGKS